MSGDAQSLYQGAVLEHGKRPHNHRVPPDASHRARGDNPLCGDQIDVYLRMEQGVIRDIAFDGVGCAIAKASASMMTVAMMGADRERAQRLLDGFGRMLSTPAEAPDPGLGALLALRAVGEFPARVQCASLAWEALRNALAAGAPSHPKTHEASPALQTAREEQ
jgi:nitrogen fixation NifU-like protein